MILEFCTIYIIQLHIHTHTQDKVHLTHHKYFNFQY